MKKMIIGMLLLVTFLTYGQSNAGAIKFGFYKPSATDAGFIIGMEYGKHVDENLDVCLSVDWFKKDMVEKDYADDVDSSHPDLDDEVYDKLSESTIYDFPVMLNLTAKFPINPKFKWFLSGGFGAEMLYYSYNKFEADDKYDEKSEFAFDFNWRLGSGVMYNLGRNSEIFGEFTYHYSKPSYEIDDYKEVEVDMSGILGRCGVRYFF